MNICQVITRLIIGGAQENTVLTCQGLSERGHRVTLITGPETGPEGSLWDQTTGAGYEVIRLESMRRSAHPLRDWQTRQELRRLFQRIKPDVVHTHSSKAGILGRSAAAAAAVPVVLHTIHGMSFNRTQRAPSRLLYRWLERRAARVTTAFITVADTLIDESVAAGLGLRERFVTIRSGMETDRFAPNDALRRKARSAWHAMDDEVVVGTIARLFDHKGYEQIMDAMPAALVHNRKLRFVWIGGGANRARYESRLSAMGVADRVVFVGLLPPDEVAAQINGFDICLHASQWEGLPRALVQGLLTEVPAISFDNDGAPEVVIPEETGLLVPFGDTKRLADAIVRLAGDAELRCRMGKRGRILFLEEYDWRNMVDRIEALCLRLVNEA